MAQVISMMNFKGGAAKTTTTFNIGCGLAAFYNMRVLLIDNDPQSNLTFACCDIQEWHNHIAQSGSINDLYSAFVDDRSSPIARISGRRPLGPQLTTPNDSGNGTRTIINK